MIFIHHPGESEASFLPMLPSLRVRRCLFKGLSETNSSRTGVRDPRLSNIFSFCCSLLVPFQSAVLIDTKGRGVGGGKKKEVALLSEALLLTFMSAELIFFFRSCSLSVTLLPFCLWFHYFSTFIFVFFSIFPLLLPHSLFSCQQLPLKTVLSEQHLDQ